MTLLSLRRAPLLATSAVVVSAVLAACGSSTPGATPVASAPAVATAVATQAATPAPTAVATTAPVATAAPSTGASAEPTSGASSAPSQAPVTTPVPGSTLDPSLSDAGVVGRVTIPDDTRRTEDSDHTGTYDIVGRKDDGSFGSFCESSFSGDDFTASANVDQAPYGQLGQMLISIPIDEMPANDGETRAGIVDGRVSVYFSEENPFGTTYSADEGATTDPGTDTIQATQVGEMIIFDFTATTWDGVDFSGQMRCASTGE